MVPSHTAPVIGSEAVQRQLTDYRDAIAWIFAETIRVREEKKCNGTIRFSRHSEGASSDKEWRRLSIGKSAGGRA
jgi:alkyl sulfatase BDS1-like metallo-beta-lactamase superfamily hydrolase